MKKKRTVSSSRQSPESRLTQKDISEALGLSQSTVAMALNPKYSHRLLDSTVNKVRAYVQKVGYQISGGASVFDPSVKTIAIVTRVGRYTSLRDMLNCLVNEFNRHNVRLLVLDLDWLDNNFERLRELLHAQPLHGLVAHSLTLTTDVENLKAVLPAGVPVLGLQCEVADSISLRVDMVDAFYQLTRLHLAETGVKSVALLMSFRDEGHITRPIWLMHERVQGFVMAVLHAGGEVVADPEVCEMLELPVIRESFSTPEPSLCARVFYPKVERTENGVFGHGYRITCELIDSGELPQVLLCSNDDIALGALAACADKGLRVPEDLRLCGCDNTDPAAFASVGITSITRPWEAMAEETVRTLMGFIESGEVPSAAYEKRFMAQVVVRASSGSRERVEQQIAQLRPAAQRSFVCESNRLPPPVFAGGNAAVLSNG